MHLTYRHTRYACNLASFTQAIVVNFAPLLFVTFQHTFGFTLAQIALLISVNFCTQIVVDLLMIVLIDRTGFRMPMVAANVLTAVGLVLMGVLPGIMPPFAALATATVVMASGSGLIEVVNSPVLETLPGDEKAAAMALMHSFYAWGQLAVILVSTLYFTLFGVDNWRTLAYLWALIPFFNLFLFAVTPIGRLAAEETRRSPGKLLTSSAIWLLLVSMICLGAAEQVMAQWSSLFAELGLGVGKTMGDLLGPAIFAALLGVGRVYFGLRGGRIDLNRALILSALLSFCTYLITVFSRSAIVSLIGCGLTGLAVSVLWPGTLSLASSLCPSGGGALFAMMALLGDVGCSLGPFVVGYVSDAVTAGDMSLAQRLFHTQAGVETGLNAGIFCASVFPLILFFCLLALRRRRRRKAEPAQ